MGLGRASVHDLGCRRRPRPAGIHPGARRARQSDRLTGTDGPTPGTGVAEGTGVIERLSPRKKSRKSIAAHAPTIGARQVNSAYHRRVAFPSELANSTSRQLQSTSSALIVPVGSTEQHGPHLPLDTDTRIATAVARMPLLTGSRTRDESNWLVAPAIGYGASGEHEDFRGTVSIGTSALRLLLVEFGRSASQLGVAPRLRQRPRRKCRGAGRRGGFASVRGPRRRLVLVQRRERRCTRRPHRNVCIATYFAERRVGR